MAVLGPLLTASAEPAAAASTPHAAHLVERQRHGPPATCEDLLWAARQGLVAPDDVAELAAAGLSCPHPQYVVMLALHARGGLTCGDVEWNTAFGQVDLGEGRDLASRLAGCELSAYATLSALVGGGLTCADVAWHAERGLVGPDQAAALRAALGSRGVPCAEPAVAEPHTFGTSLEGRPLVAWRRRGSPQPTRRVLAVGLVHGDEPGGRAVTDLLLTTGVPADLELWVVPSLNPDGEAAGRRGNAHGVDLNRNFPTGWLPPGSDPLTSGGYDSGPGPASEPEVVAAMQLIAAVRPDLTLWYHQPWGAVVCDVARAGTACTDYATEVGLDLLPADRPGSAIGWQAAEGLGAALVVELVEGPPPPEVAERHARAALAGHGP